MFTLAKLSYFECYEFQKCWYNTTPNNVIKFDIRLCCEILMTYIKGNKKINCWRKYTTCSIAANSGHLDCLQLVHKLGFPWNTDICMASAKNGDLGSLKFAHDNGCS